MSELNTPSDVPSGAGVAPAQEGVILQRGGEELALERAGDRFTVRLTEGSSVDEVGRRVGAQSVTAVPSVQLIEMQVAPEQLDQAMQQARSLDAVEYASHVYRICASPNNLVYLTDEITIQFASAATAQEMAAIASEIGLRQFQPVVGIPQTFIYRVTKAARSNPIKLANQLMRRSEVLTAEPNVVARMQKLHRPSDSEYSPQWYLNHSGGTDLTAGSHISAEAAWDITRGDRSIVVAITDDGFDLSHPDFQGAGKIAAPRDLKQRDPLPLPETAGENHGTSCAGLAIAEETGSGIVGVAPGCTFMPIRTSGYLDDGAIEELFQWAMERGASVISCSWGPSLNYYSLSLRQRAAISRAATQGRNGRGCVIVFAAGNANRPVNGTVAEQGWPQNVLSGPTQWLNGFALHPDVIAVSACTSLNRKAAYSNWGTTISVAAPSNNAPPGTWIQSMGYVLTAPPVRGALRGRGVFTSDRVGQPGYESGNFTQTFGGTSSACPIVAGVAALVLSVNPDLTAREVKQILQDTADNIVDPDPDPQLGLRRGTYDANGHSQWFGYGKVNALKAVRAAQQRIRSPQVKRRLRSQSAAVMNIPDGSLQGITSTIQISETAPVQDIQVTLEVEHSFLGDLEINLVAPSGQTVLLQGRTLGRQTQLQTTFTLRTTPALRRMLSQSAAGRWQLHLVDAVPQNSGRLLNWQLDIGI